LLDILIFLADTVGLADNGIHTAMVL
jgi:hypothetical protein